MTCLTNGTLAWPKFDCLPLHDWHGPMDRCATHGYAFLLRAPHLFMWDVAQGRVVHVRLLSVEVGDQPYGLSCSSAHARLYLIYQLSSGKGAVTYLSLDSTGALLLYLPAGPCGLKTVGEFLMTCDYSGAWKPHSIWRVDGSLVQKQDWNYYSRHWAYALGSDACTSSGTTPRRTTSFLRSLRATAGSCANRTRRTTGTTPSEGRFGRRSMRTACSQAVVTSTTQ